MSPSSPLPRRVPAAAAMTLAIALAACSGGAPPEPLACTDRAQCPGDAFCRAGACVQSAPPIARIASLAADAPRANRVLAFDASSSADPDAEDRVVRFAWRTERVSAACEPSVVESAAAAYRVLFPCEGEFRIALSVTDSAGVTSAPAALLLNVAPDDVAAPAVHAGAALALEHRCDGEPLSCTPLSEAGATTFALSASAAGGRGPVALRWTASPPPGLETPYSVAFSDATASAPTVALRTTGAISGTWTFTVVASDAEGRAAVAVQEVAIGNRAPVLAEPLAPVAVHHAYVAAEQAYRAEGIAPAPRFADPDGDPVSVRFAAESAGDGGHGFTVLPDGGFSVRIPAAEPQHLIGEDVARAVVVEADDGNGGRTAVAVPVAVLNRAPRIALSRSVATVPHAYDPARRVYSASMTLSDYVDDDGDPILPGATFEQTSRGCSALALSGATLGLTCEVPLSTVAALATLVGSHVLEVTVQDPWDHSARAAARFEVTNRPPRLTTTYFHVKAVSTPVDVCCWDGQEGGCALPLPRVYEPADASLSAVEDPDGDPLDVTYAATAPVLLLSRGSVSACTGTDCAVGLHLDGTGGADICAELPDPGSVRVSLTDGAASLEAAVRVVRPPP